MSEKKDMPSSEEKDGLNFEDVKNLTIEEAVRKGSEMKAGITESDGVLDKYIKQHRDEVTSQKFETKLSDFEDLDTKALDNFIKKQREELVNSGIVSKDVFEETVEPKSEDVVEPVVEVAEVKEVETEPEQAETVDAEKEAAKEVKATTPKVEEAVAAVEEPKEAPVAIPAEEVKEAEKEATSIALSADDNKPTSKKKRVIIGGLAVLVVAIFGAGYALHYTKDSTTTVASSSTSSSQKKPISSSSAAKKAKKAFDDAYAALFTDDTKTKLKNSEFDKISVLKEKLDDLKGTDFYDAAKKQYDTVAAHITAIKAINALFEKDVIVDGKKVSGTVKADAKFDSLSSDVLNTGDANLDNLLQSVITDGKNQLAAKAQSSSQAQAAANAASQTESSDKAAEAKPAAPDSDNSNLQRDKSRVPYNYSAIADSSNPAWTFGDGVLEKIVSTSQTRGYFSGNDYILEKVNIINGNGYYNMFRKDGTYLFSINCKTGYFVGNGSGHSDALDY
ncbi:Mid-cell-anchored protein Z [Streptococcus infantarius subsp. infantarius]|uniref:cell division site-positioning protein MapZ family protein n=1 Tax=Streptococcus infantarius TaxID=102684 RepID=UPI00208EDD77|nr:cell division site-positioning protein MapZ family protein [Streptococcus infantarius]MCO4471683.1 Mid-cell-anchored protein Z [Streptococcus infantarius subsp. infantarius]MCO4475445.1 Mid-cell-anchored protein Z [Streptococcus infantarius subsp. infantarius]MCO4483774.1 Mid-cell-anchored protein Z [Streptococcus infantarius subsp. infantarius]MCO4496726.1 Mid-cell-anchored protein Z [Streptococcus infantarius subsp. infantarius]MCY7239178.1 cell division site-positioning protein MapZ fami